eukprot:NODE_422_length_926_cov_299.535492_g414_i0.p1 GENE.NODE_422_length_926_cov_299.535492_g414_i0~~NODE_422_length_926_cov_299.535492_g414_i0.p1  ORF type:complete len:259 (+),score=29.44 NODE_422_length_926_cov_299.535492_g414_i0:94-777(+)
MHAADWYYPQGINRKDILYFEPQFNMYRLEHLHISRQQIYDITWTWTVSQGWMFVPLTAYHSSWPGSYLEPLSTNFDIYDYYLAQTFLSGVMACWRGYRLFDTPEVKKAVTTWTKFYKKNREILNSDIIHIRRPDMQGIDGFMHVNPLLPVKGLAAFFNPTEFNLTETFTINMYYTGICATTASRITITWENADTSHIELNRFCEASVDITMTLWSYRWFTVVPYTL